MKSSLFVGVGKNSSAKHQSNSPQNSFHHVCIHLPVSLLTCQIHISGYERVLAAAVGGISEQNGSRDWNEIKQVSQAKHVAETKVEDAIPFVTLVFGGRKVIKTLVVRHIVPDIVTFTEDFD